MDQELCDVRDPAAFKLAVCSYFESAPRSPQGAAMKLSTASGQKRASLEVADPQAGQ
ncbi:MAG: hypothetical protein ACXVJJ_06230 [Halobacteriota archaeon]